MGSIPGRFSGLGSAINNSISRVGQPLLGALIFIAISATFYAVLGVAAPGLDTDVAGGPLDVPAAQPAAGRRHAEQAIASNEASIAAFHLAMLITSALLLTGGARVVVRPARAPHPGRRGGWCGGRDDSLTRRADRPRRPRSSRGPGTALRGRG